MAPWLNTHMEKNDKGIVEKKVKSWFDRISAEHLGGDRLSLHTAEHRTVTEGKTLLRSAGFQSMKRNIVLLNCPGIIFYYNNEKYTDLTLKILNMFDPNLNLIQFYPKFATE